MNDIAQHFTNVEHCHYFVAQRFTSTKFKAKDSILFMGRIQQYRAILNKTAILSL